MYILGKEVRWQGLLRVLLVVGKDLITSILKIYLGLPWGISIPLIPWTVKYHLVLVVVVIHAAVNNLAYILFLIAFGIARISNCWKVEVI
jgi:hypothetical protein